jgi:fructose-1,6-bisphosphatase II
MLYSGEVLGTGDEPPVDIAVDPIDGTRLLALGRPNAISVVALSERGTMYDPKHIFYMNKIAAGPEAAEVIDIEAPIAENLKGVAKALHKSVEDVTVVVLDRPRHEQIISEIRSAGARIRLIPDGDIAGALMTCREESGIDLLVGIGGSPEAVVSACALKCVGGNMQCKLWPRNSEEAARCRELGMDLRQVLSINDLVSSDNVFFAATGVTDGELLKGVRYEGSRIRTASLVMRSKSGTIRYVDAIHSLRKLEMFSDIEYGPRYD